MIQITYDTLTRDQQTYHDIAAKKKELVVTLEAKMKDYEANLRKALEFEPHIIVVLSKAIKHSMENTATKLSRKLLRSYPIHPYLFLCPPYAH